MNQILKELARGNSVTGIPDHPLLSTQQAADILNVSGPFVVKLLEEGQIPYRRPGSQRRIRFGDLLAFKAKAEAAANGALQALTDEAQEMGPGY